MRLQRRDHRVVVRELLQPELLDLRLYAPVGVVAREVRDLVLLELDEVERPRADDGRGVGERLQAGSLLAEMLRPDVLRKDEELLELPEDVAGRLLVVDGERCLVRRGRLCDVRDQTGDVRRGAVRVLDGSVDRPSRVGRGERLAVAPLGVSPRLERPGPPVLGVAPRAREERRELEVAVVLDQDGVDVLERAVGVLVEGDVRVEGVDAAGRAEPEGAAATAAAAVAAVAAAALRPSAAGCSE